MARVELDTFVLKSFIGQATVAVAAAVQVNVRNGGAATVYAAETGGTTLANPLSTDSQGRVEGWVEEGSYDLVVSGAGIATYTERYEAYAGSVAARLAVVEAAQSLSLHSFAGVDPTGVGDSTAGVAAATVYASGLPGVTRLQSNHGELLVDTISAKPNVLLDMGETRIKKRVNGTTLETNSLLRAVPVLTPAAAAGNGTTASGSDQVTGLTNVGAIWVGRRISGAGIPAGAKVKALNTAASSLTLTAPATASATVALTMGQTYYGAYQNFGVIGGIWDRNGFTCPAHVINLQFIEGLRFEDVTVENYAGAGCWATFLWARNAYIRNYKCSGGSSILEDGLHIGGGQHGVIDGYDIGSGDDALAFGANPSTDVFAAADPDSIRDWTVGPGVVRSERGNALRVYAEAGTSSPNNEVTDLTVRGMVGYSGRSRNGGVLIEDMDHPAAGLSQVRGIDLQARLAVGSHAHDDANSRALWILSADDVTLDVDLDLAQKGGVAQAGAGGFAGAILEDCADLTLDLRCDTLQQRHGVSAKRCPRFSLGPKTRLRRTGLASLFHGVELEDCPDFSILGSRVLNVEDGLNGVSVVTGTTSSGKIVGAKIEHAAGATSGYSIACLSAAFTSLQVVANKLQRPIYAVGMPTAKTLILGNDGAPDNILALPDYVEVREGRLILGSATPASTYLFGPSAQGGTANSAASIHSVFRLNPADYALNGRTPKLRVCAAVITNAVAPGCSFGFGLCPIATWGGAAGSDPYPASVGAALGPVTVGAPAAGGASPVVNSAEFAVPAAGHYALVVTPTAVTAATSVVEVIAYLQLCYD